MLAAAMASGAVSATAHAGVMAWGSNRDFQLGTESVSRSDLPLSVSGLGEVAQVVASDNYSLALLRNGQVWAWGRKCRRLGDGETGGRTSAPVEVSGLSEVTAISSTHAYSLALLRDGEVMAWGVAKGGRLGDGEEGASGSSDTPVRVHGLTEVTAVSAGQFHALAVLKNGTVMAWGLGKRGELGDGEGLSGSDVPVPVKGITEAVAVAAGNVHSLVLLRNGTVLSFGANEFGQLGDGHRKPSYVAVPVEGLSEVTAISAGGWSNLALLRNGTVTAWAWTNWASSATARGAAPKNARPGGAATSRSRSAGSAKSRRSRRPATPSSRGTTSTASCCSRNGTAMAWGGNEDGQLGDGTRANSYVRVPVQGLTGVTGISAGGYDSLAIVEEDPLASFGL